MKQYALILLSAALALSGCGDSEPDASAPATQASSDNPLSGVWVKDQQVLVLESNGDFYLPSDALRQGLSWEQQGNQFTFRYLDSNALSIEQQSLAGTLEDNSLDLSALPGAATPEPEDGSEQETLNADSTPLFSGTFQRDSSAVGYLGGQVQLPEGADLPQQAVLTVTLFSAGDVVLRRVIRLNGNDSHYPFRLYYPADAVDADQPYQISSQILAGGGIFYQSALADLSRNEQGFENITLPLDPVMSDSETLRGALIWQQQTPVFILCNSDQRLQVSGPQGKALVNDIRQDMAYPQQPRIATVSGVRRKIPGEQEGTTQAAVAVESYSLDAVGSFRDCQIPSAELTNTRWVLSHLADEAVALPEGSQTPYLTFTAEQARGNGGCNSFQGGYQQEGDSLRFQPLASTKMACPAMETEQAFHQALSNSNRYRIDGELLTLFDEEDQAVASFQALYL
ncbi:META domain-containing protein [Alcanivorax sp. S6407]|uniref:META domain-containing protein n=1 Tax=Alcanivorax sp. S6407 TaxID=2926424 RepID=UPI001FF225F1|nr:META domain-containing protein [Alcanivorax sp. S6407]MCK0154046.1 META domain-containing protein [Alcanivorax sp. S6407]